MVDMRCKRGAKAMLYWRCCHEYFARYDECARWDGMIERLTQYEVATLARFLDAFIYSFRMVCKAAGS